MLTRTFAVRVLGLAVLLAGITPSQAGTITNGLLLQLGLDNGAPDTLFISVDGVKDSQPGCHDNGSWDYVLPINTDQNKRLYVMLLAARASGAPITLTGNSACVLEIETLHAVYY